jgi:hypothetical protein
MFARDGLQRRRPARFNWHANQMRPPHDKYAQAAAVQFDRACRLMPRHSNQQIADALSDVLGVTISRRAVADWRRGFTEIKASYLLAAFDLAGIVQVLEIGALPGQRSGVEAGQALAPAAGGHTRRWNGRPRLQVIGAGLSFLLFLLWALPHTPLAPYVDVVVSYASHMAQPESGSGGGSAQRGTARAPSREPAATPQPAAPTATPTAAPTPATVTGQVDQGGATPTPRAAPAQAPTATAAVAQPPATPAPAPPQSPPGQAKSPAQQAGASGNQVPSQAAAPAQPPGLVPGVVNGVVTTVDTTLGVLTGS